MRRLNEVMDIKFSLLIFKQFHRAITRSQKKMFTHICTTVLRGQFPWVASGSRLWSDQNISSWCISSLPNSRPTLYVHSRSWWSRL